MVRYWVSHGFGNQLFHYWMARIVAKELGLMLHFEGFYFDHRLRKLLISHLELPLFLPGKKTPPPAQKVEHKAGALFDIARLDSSREVHVNPDGHSTFEWYPYFREHKELIRRVMKSHVGFSSLKPRTLGIHLRLTDVPATYPIPCAAFYEKAVAEYKPKEVLVVTDESDHAFARYLAWRYATQPISSSPISDFFLLASCDAIVASNSTFSWWAAFVSDAQVYHPWKKHGTTKDLRVDDERYHFVDFDWDAKVRLYGGKK